MAASSRGERRRNPCGENTRNPSGFGGFTAARKFGSALCIRSLDAADLPCLCFERYADDAIVHCRTESEARTVMEAIRKRLAECGLELHPEKTRIVYFKDNKRRKECEHISFDFLGYTFQPRSARDRKGEKFLNFLPVTLPPSFIQS
ncbi:reverse transcriptase domain-containing protein [Bradyrhizobium yuanmingense]|uniref:reverse transcriptase domain-containing protein n=1 Tax=Bradyrhizobium yuanmingense TaxID=108015 RepID=UPI003516DA6B